MQLYNRLISKKWQFFILPILAISFSRGSVGQKSLDITISSLDILSTDRVNKIRIGSFLWEQISVFVDNRIIKQDAGYLKPFKSRQKQKIENITSMVFCDHTSTGNCWYDSSRFKMWMLQLQSAMKSVYTP